VNDNGSQDLGVAGERLKAPGLPKDLATVSGCRSDQAEEDSTAGVSGAGGLDLGAAYEASADSISERLFNLVARYGPGGDVKEGPWIARYAPTRPPPGLRYGPARLAAQPGGGGR
jgi:hypothetical protein